MSLIPDTPTMLLTRLALQASGEDEAAWTEFFELYTPVMRRFLAFRDVDAGQAEDIIQDVLAKLVTILRNRRYDKERSHFRTYLSHLLYNEMVDHYRRSRRWNEYTDIDKVDCIDETASTAGDALDREWAAAKHKEAVAHILNKTALSEQSKRIYQELEVSGDTCEAVAKRMGLAAATVRQIKSRVGRMVAALERRLDE
jgi:RNA polymerase sigma-70 factor (ECF subfamily)